MITYWTTQRPTENGRYWYRNKEQGIMPKLVSCVMSRDELFGGSDEWLPGEKANMMGGEWSMHAVGYDDAGACLEEGEYWDIVSNPQPYR